jgi:hypothetical protein
MAAGLQNSQPAKLADCTPGSLFQTWSFVKGNATSGFLQNAAGRVPPLNKPFCMSLDDCQPTLTVMYDCSPSSDCSNHSFSHFRWSLIGNKVVSAFDTRLCLTVSTGTPYPYASATTGPCAGATEWEFASGALRDKQSGQCLTTDTADTCVIDFAAKCLSSASPSACSSCIDGIYSTPNGISTTHMATPMSAAALLPPLHTHSNGNECNATKGCNVCTACCQSYIKDGAVCDSCVAAQCKKMTNECQPSKGISSHSHHTTLPHHTATPHCPKQIYVSCTFVSLHLGCNVCSRCCQSYIDDGPDCDACVKVVSRMIHNAPIPPPQFQFQFRERAWYSN